MFVGRSVRSIVGRGTLPELNTSATETIDDGRIAAITWTA